MTIQTASPFLPKKHSLAALRAAAGRCEGCTLFERATQTVFGEGPARAELVIVGEMPGDQEDQIGRPFVGAAGRLLDDVIEQAGMRRDECYLTNAVKHFSWAPRGKRRLHRTPSSREVAACRPWLEAEILSIQPRLVVCLGATAAQSFAGRDFRITKQHGQFLKGAWECTVLATYHPSAVLRARTPDDRRRLRDELVEDLTAARNWLADHKPARSRR